MPSPIGHALAGVAVAWFSELLPTTSGLARRHSIGFTGLCAALAAAPDLDLIYPPSHRTVTHSVGAVAFTLIVAIVVTGWVKRRRVGQERREKPEGWRKRVGSVAIVCTAAYASHLLLDWLGSDPSWPAGIQALWPINQHWYISGVNLFPYIERREMLSSTSIIINLKAIAGEVAIMGPIVGVVGLLRRSEIKN